jgi:fluoride exporter
MQVVLVMVGGFFGAVCRFLLGTLEVLHKSTSAFPYPTLIVNLVGSLVLGILVAVIQKRYPNVFLFLGTGFIGSFTTFSTFSVEVLTLLEKGKPMSALIYVSVSIVAGIALSFVGYKVGLQYKGREGRTI